YPSSHVRGGVSAHEVTTPTTAAKRTSPAPRSTARATRLAASNTRKNAATCKRRIATAASKGELVNPATLSLPPSPNVTEHATEYVTVASRPSRATRMTRSSRLAPTAWPASTDAASETANAGRNENWHTCSAI